MRQRFTQLALNIFVLTQKAAERLSHQEIGTEHLLLGIVQEEYGIAGRVLRELGATPERIAEIIERTTDTRPRGASDHKPNLTPEVKQIIEFAVDEARVLSQTLISTEHLLLGLMRLADNTALIMLHQLGLTPDLIRLETQRAVQIKQQQDKDGAALS